MSRRIDIELTSNRDDGSWTWRAAGAREPRGTLESEILPEGAAVGQVLHAEVEGHLDGISIVSVLPPRTPRFEPERLELKPTGTDQPLVTSTLAPKRSGERGRRNDRGQRPATVPAATRASDVARAPRASDVAQRRPRQEGRHERSARPAPPPIEDKPKPKRLRPGKAHRTALLEAVPAEQRPIAEQLLAGGIPAVRQAIEKQNEELKAAGKTEVKPDALLRVAEDLRSKAAAAAWRDRAEAAVQVVDELDLRDLRSVVNASGDAGRDDESKALAVQLREALANRVEKEHAAWLAELAETVQAGRVVRALRLSSRPPKAGAPIPGDIATQLAEATAASLTSDTGPDRWATVLDALAYSPVRRRVIPQSLPEKLHPELKATIARLASRLPEVAHIFDIEPDPAAERAARNANRRGGRKGDDRGKGGKPGKGRGDRDRGRGAKGGRDGKPGEKAAGSPQGRSSDKADAKPASPQADAPATETHRRSTHRRPSARDRRTADRRPPSTHRKPTPATEAPATDAPQADARDRDGDRRTAGRAPQTEARRSTHRRPTHRRPRPAVDAPQADAPQTETPAVDAPQAEAPETEAAGADAPAPEAPPATEAADAEAPAGDQSSAESPAVDAAAPDSNEAGDAEAPVAGVTNGRRAARGDRHPRRRRRHRVERRGHARRGRLRGVRRRRRPHPVVRTRRGARLRRSTAPVAAGGRGEWASVGHGDAPPGGSALAGGEHGLDAAAPAIATGRHVLVPTGTTALARTRIDAERTDEQALDLVGLTERAL